MNGPLHGIRVVDFTELLPGPFTTQSLVEMGAEVLKIERPTGGDPLRQASPGLFAAVNRGKRSLMADLKSDEGRAVALDRAATADIVIEGFRPGVMERLGLGYEAVAARNPQVIYLSLTGYGQSGPLRNEPGHDLNYLASAGVTSLCGTPGEAPRHGIGLPVADLGGASYALSALLAALFQRERSGRGQYLDVSMTDCMAHWMNTRKAVCQSLGIADLAGQRAVALTRPAYGVFDCRDGAITIAALEGHFWQALVKVLDLVPFSGPKHRASAARLRDCAGINAAIARQLAEMSLDEALALLRKADIPASPVLSMGAANASEHFLARGLAHESPAGPLTPFPVHLEGMGTPPGAFPALNEADLT